jgi:hypothetical protein
MADMVEFPNIFVSPPLCGSWDLQTTRFPTSQGNLSQMQLQMSCNKSKYPPSYEYGRTICRFIR